MGFENSGIRPKPINFKELNILSDVPKAFFNKKLVMIVKQYFRNQINPKEFLKNFNNRRFIDTVFDLGCYKYLDESKKSANYTVKRVYDHNEELEKLTYTHYDNSSNFKVYITLPPELYILPTDQIEFLQFDPNEKNWSKKNIKSVSKEFHKDNQKIFYEVSIPQMTPIAAFTYYWNEFPYRYFKIRRIGYRTVLFDLNTQRIFLSFRITPGRVELVNCDKPEFKRFEGKLFSPQKILLELVKSNIFLLPDRNLAVGCEDINIKIDEVESFTLREVTKACLFFHIQLSIWNSKTKNNSLILRIRENPEQDVEFHENTEVDWHTIQFKSFKCKVLKILENSEEFSKERWEESISHLNLYFLVNNYKKKFKPNYYDENFIEEEILLIDTIFKLLQPMHLFGFCF